MPEPLAAQPELDEALVVRTHVTPWGFLVALPLALGFAYLGARALDAGISPHRIASLEDAPIWLFSALLIGFALFLFLVGVGELASYLKPAVEIVLDRQGIVTFGMLGERRLAWDELVEVRLDGAHLSLRGRPGERGGARNMRLHFNRLAVPPAALIARIERRRPDLGPILGAR